MCLWNIFLALLLNFWDAVIRLAKQPTVNEEELDPELMMLDDERPESLDDTERSKDIRKGIDLATTLERIAKNFVITDPRLPDNPIVRPHFILTCIPVLNVKKLM